MAHPYRDSKGVSAERLKSLRAQIADLEGRFSEAFWSRVAPELGIERELQDVETETPIADDIQAAEVRVDLLEQTVGRLGRLESEWCTPAHSVARIGVGALGGISSNTATAHGWPQNLTESVRKLDATFEMKPRGLGIEGGSLVADGVPLDIQQAWSLRGIVLWTFATTVARILGPLRIEHEGTLDGILDMLGLQAELELADDRFDPVFLVRGDEPTARAVLKPEARELLLRIGEETSPVFRIAAGQAALAWPRGPTSPGIVQSAIRLMVIAHRTRCPYSLTRT